MRLRERINEILDKLSVDVLLISDGYNMRYLSGFTGGTGYLYITRERNVLLTDFRYTIQAEREAPDWEILEISSDRKYEDAINALLREDGKKTLGFEGESLLYTDYAKLKKELKAEKLVDVESEVTELRQVKTPKELDCSKKAEQIGDLAFSKILEIIKPGMTELEIAAWLEFFMKTNGADNLSFDTIVASGVNSAMCHAVPTEKKVEKGDFVTMDFGCKYKGYCSDMTRTIVIGRASAEQKKVYATVLEAQKKALDFICAGQIGKEVDKVARDYIYAAGYEGCFGHGLGHSTGLYIHENPRYAMTEENRVLENVVMTVEPGIYIKDFGGVRIEDMICVTKEGHINYTSSEKNLIEL
jgi:Xaa-Pro aminopeptidase